MSQDLFQALSMFNQGAQELAIGRATRQAADQAQQINMMEGDEFQKRQAFQQLGQGLAAQLSSFGASPAQVHQMSQNFMPQQLSTPQDFFAQAAQATSPQAAQQYTQAGNKIQANIAAAPLTTAQNEQFKIQKLGLLNQAQADMMASRAQKVKDEDMLSVADKKTIETLASKSAQKLSITGNLQSLIAQWPSLGESEKLQQGREIMKVLNSTEGSDAVGAEEVKRLGSKLEFALGNFTNSNEIQFGRNLEGFFQDVQNTAARLSQAVERSDLAVSKIYKKYGKDVPVQSQSQTNSLVPPQDEAIMQGIQQKWNNLAPEQQQRVQTVLQAMKAKKERKK